MPSQMTSIPLRSGAEPDIAAPVMNCGRLTRLIRHLFKVMEMDPSRPRVPLILSWHRLLCLLVVRLGPFPPTPTLTIPLRRWEVLLSLPTKRAFSNR